MTTETNQPIDASNLYGVAVGPTSWIAVKCLGNVFQDISFHETESEAIASALDFLKPDDRIDATKTIKFNRNLTVGGWNVAVRSVNLPAKPYAEVFGGDR